LQLDARLRGLADPRGMLDRPGSLARRNVARADRTAKK
jgi:hypothetical protein